MNIVLKNVKHSALASQETECFVFSIYVDGQKLGFASNDGRGGNTSISPNSLRITLDEYAATLPPVDLAEVCESFIGHKNRYSPQTGETVVETLLQDVLENKYLKKLCKNKVLFRKPNVKYSDGEYDTVIGAFSPELMAKIIAKYGESTIFLNSSIE